MIRMNHHARASAFSVAVAILLATPVFAQGGPGAPADGGSAPRRERGERPGRGERAEAQPAAKVGEKAPAFTLKDAAGKEYSLEDYKGKTVVLQWINPGCPVCNGLVTDGSVATMEDQAKAADPDVVFLFINSTYKDRENGEKSAKYLADGKVDGPALIDGEGAVGQAYGAKVTPHCFVVDGSGTLVYAGAIDNEESGDKRVNYVVNAVSAVKSGKQPSPATTRPYGCGVKYKK